VNEEKKIVGIGYNGMPNRCSDDEMPWGREGDDILDTKQLYGKGNTSSYLRYLELSTVKFPY